MDLDAFANEKLALDDGAEISALAVRSDGSAFFTMTYETRKIMAVIDGAGAITKVTDVAGDSGDISGFLVDAEGHLDVLWNSPAGAIVTSYTHNGSEVFSRPFTCQTGFIGGLAAGSSFVVMQSGPCGMDLTGKNLFGGIGAGDAVTIDAANNLYFLALAGLASQEATGALRWSVPLSTSLVSAPLLATNGQLFTAEVAAPGSDSDGPLYVVAHDTSSGVELARYPTGTTSPGPLDVRVRLTAVGEAVVGLESGAVALWVGQSPDSTAQWPTESGGADRRNVAQGQ